MRIANLFFLILLFGLSAFGLDKHLFDIMETDESAVNSAPVSLARIPYPGWDYVEAANTMLEADLLRTGQFTIGTVNGTHAGILDDDQPLTFGHPLSKTSYALLEFDGTLYRLDNYYTDLEMDVNQLSDTHIELVCNNGILLTRLIIEVGTQLEHTIHFDLSLTNLDGADHVVRSGFVLDPALGDWGDGWISVQGVPISSPAVYDNANISEITIDERKYLNTGMQLSITYDEPLPGQILIDNWMALRGYQEADLNALYDAALQWLSPQTTLSNNDILNNGFQLELGIADYPDGPFIRSQIPQMLDLFQNLVTPSDLNCLTIIENNGTPAQMVELTLRNETILQEWTSTPFTISGMGRSFQHLPIAIPELYEDRVYPLTLELKNGDNILSVLERPMFIPASSFSDTGLQVLADTVIISEYPLISTVVEVTREATGQNVFDLNQQNFLITEGQTRIYDFYVGPDTTEGVGSADIVFVLDVTGSMSEEINQVKAYLRQFAQALAAQDIDFRLAMVTFLDIVENVYPFTSDVDLFQSYVDAQYHHGGNDIPENSLEALNTAAHLPFRDGAGRIFIWITDARYHIANEWTALTPAAVVDSMLAEGVTCHAVSPEGIRVEWIDPVIVPTGGDWYDINGNFLDILLDVANLGGTSKYLINYTTPNTGTASRVIDIEVHTAGLGGSTSIEYTPPGTSLGKDQTISAHCYPNPFNPSVVIDLTIPDHHRGEVVIYNVLGREVRSYPIQAAGSQQIIWDATDSYGQVVSAGLYLVDIRLKAAQTGPVRHELIKLIHSN